MAEANRVNATSTGVGAIRVVSWGHGVFAVTMIALGVLGLIQHDFLPTWAGVPNGMPGRRVLLYLCSSVSLATGIGLLWQRTALLASRILLGFFLAWLLLVRLPNILFAPTVIDTWWGAGDTAVMTAAAWVLFGWFAGDDNGLPSRFATGDRGLRFARVLYGWGLIPWGIAHFTYLKRTVDLVPGWLPLHVGWAYLTGATFIAASLAVLTGVFARLAVTLTALQMGLFALLVWAPRVAAGSLSAFQWGEVVSTLALTAAAWVVADSYHDTAWLAVGARREVRAIA